MFWAAGLKKIFCIPLCAELHEGVETIRTFQRKPEPLVQVQPKVSVTSLMAAMAATVLPALGKWCLLVLDAYFAVGPVFAILKKVRDDAGHDLVHVVTRAKSNVVAYIDAPPKTGRPGRPRVYGQKLSLIKLFDTHRQDFQQTRIELYGQVKSIAYLCLDLIWKPVGQKVGFILVADDDRRGQRLIAEATDAIEAFVNFGCIACGILQILALNFHETIWRRYMGWLRTVSSSIPSEEIVRSVVQQEYCHNFHAFSTDAICRTIMSKSRGCQQSLMPLVA